MAAWYRPTVTFLSTIVVGAFVGRPFSRFSPSDARSRSAVAPRHLPGCVAGVVPSDKDGSDHESRPTDDQHRPEEQARGAGSQDVLRSSDPQLRHRGAGSADPPLDGRPGARLQSPQSRLRGAPRRLLDGSLSRAWLLPRHRTSRRTPPDGARPDSDMDTVSAKRPRLATRMRSSIRPCSGRRSTSSYVLDLDTRIEAPDGIMLDGFVRDSTDEGVFLVSVLPALAWQRDYLGDRWFGTSHESSVPGCIRHRLSWIRRACGHRDLLVQSLGRELDGQLWLHIFAPAAARVALHEYLASTTLAAPRPARRPHRTAAQGTRSRWWPALTGATARRYAGYPRTRVHRPCHRTHP